MNARPEFLTDSLIVAAHPDDEMLWFNAIVADVDRIVVVFNAFWDKPHIAEARAAALAAYPRGGVSCLDLSESGTYGCANWADPVESEHGIALSFETRRRDVTRVAKLAVRTLMPQVGLTVSERQVASIYAMNFDRLCSALRAQLHPGMNVFTHNPWGEYGHEEHIQVFRALQLLRREIGFTLWMSNYCTDRSMPLAMRYFRTSPGPYVRLPTNKAFADTIADVYKRHGCWTWADDWAWFDEECYMQAPEEGTAPEPHRHLFPLNFFTIEPRRAFSWKPIAIGASAATLALSAAMD